METLHTVTEIRHRHPSSVGSTLAGSRIPLSEGGCQLKALAWATFFLLGSEGKPFFLLLEASKATGRYHHRGSWSLPRLARTAACLREQALGSDRSELNSRHQQSLIV